MSYAVLQNHTFLLFPSTKSVLDLERWDDVRGDVVLMICLTISWFKISGKPFKLFRMANTAPLKDVDAESHSPEAFCFPISASLRCRWPPELAHIFRGSKTGGAGPNVSSTLAFCESLQAGSWRSMESCLHQTCSSTLVPPHKLQERPLFGSLSMPLF